jgi:hypothetical protein
MHGDKRVYSVDQAGRRVPVLTRAHVQSRVNQKSDTPFGQRNFSNTLRAMFRWAAAEDRVPDDPTFGVTRQKSRAPATALGQTMTSLNTGDDIHSGRWRDSPWN